MPQNQDLKSFQNQAKTEVAAAQNAADLDSISSRYLRQIRSFFQELKSLSVDQRKKQGALVNDFQAEFQALVQDRKKELDSLHLEKNLKSSAPEMKFTSVKIGHLHPITQTVRMLNKLFTRMGYSVLDGPEIETDEYCFRRLNVPPDHPARDMQDTIYIEEPNFLLRTHTSSVEARGLSNFKPPMKFVVPGRVYRNEKVNKSNHFIFHHYQGVAVLKKTSLKDLFGTIDYLFKKMYGKDVVVRYRNKYYPEVEPGVGPDMRCFACKGKGCSVCKNVGWIEMGGAGMIHPNLLKAAGLSPSKWMGFAFGLGLDRWVMAKYKINDIRTLLGGRLGYKYFENENLLA